MTVLVSLSKIGKVSISPLGNRDYPFFQRTCQFQSSVMIFRNRLNDVCWKKLCRGPDQNVLLPHGLLAFHFSLCWTLILGIANVRVQGQKFCLHFEMCQNLLDQYYTYTWQIQCIFSCVRFSQTNIILKLGIANVPTQTSTMVTFL